MSILDLTSYNVNDSQDPEVADADTDVELRIVDVKMDINKSGNPYFLARFEVSDQPLTKEFTRYFALPHKDMSEKQLNACQNNMRKFGEAFDIDFSSKINLEDLKGLTGWAILGIEENEEYGEQNYVKRFTTG